MANGALPNRLETYRLSDSERARTDDLLKLLPRGRKSVLDIGARDGHFSRLLTSYFESVTALDLERPSFEIPGVETVAGDVTALTLPDRSFDCSFCAEVLEHIPALEKACQEMMRVTRHEILVGVPYRQDTRIGQFTCAACGRISPPYGHVNSFDESRLHALFPGWEVAGTSFVGSTNEVTNALSVSLLNWAGNPYGTHGQDESCIHCGVPPQPSAEERGFLSRVLSRVALGLIAVQQPFAATRGNWIHILFRRPPLP